MLTDRTRIETYQICPRLRFLTFHLGGRGIVPVLEGYDLAFGRIYHAALELLTKGMDPRLVIRQATDKLASFIDLMGTKMPLKSPQFRAEQSYLMGGLLWAWVTVKLPEMKASYEVVATEKEFTWTVGALTDDEPLIDMLRLDALLRDTSADSLYYKEYKTTGYGDQRWVMQFENNSQVMANLLAAEDVLKERMAGVLVEGHFKGRRRVDTAMSSRMQGTEIQDSILCYAYDTGMGNLSLEWRSRATRVPVWESGFSPKQWVEEILGPKAAELFIAVPPISPDPYVLERWRRQTLHQERKIFIALRMIEDERATSETQRTLLDETFPLHETSCIQYGRKCSHYEICHDRAVAEDPIGCGLFTPRTPHHAAEGEQEGGVAP